MLVEDEAEQDDYKAGGAALARAGCRVPHPLPLLPFAAKGADVTGCVFSRWPSETPSMRLNPAFIFTTNTVLRSFKKASTYVPHMVHYFRG